MKKKIKNKANSQDRRQKERKEEEKKSTKKGEEKERGKKKRKKKGRLVSFPSMLLDLAQLENRKLAAKISNVPGVGSVLVKLCVCLFLPSRLIAQKDEMKDSVR